MKTNLKELLPITQIFNQGEKQPLVNARDLWKFLESKQEFSNWIKNNIKAYGFKKDWDYFLLDKFIKQNTAQFLILKNEEQKTNNRGGHNRKDYLITLSMAKELAMVERNEQGKLARQYFLKCEDTLLNIAPDLVDKHRQEWRIEREAVKTPFTKMCNSLERNRTRLGKETHKHHYTNEANMLTSLVLGMNVQHWRTAHAITIDTREALNAEQLERLEYLEQADQILLDMNINDFHQRKARLAEMLMNKFQQ
ncbi:antA/AntB antirepressor family protein [Glaesserella parasuis]|uniref:antA/AntB antirepressor family protein n=2 Tax=Glaesserella parasuis TaxID=738 RepID=UPI0024373414|nr:antA/AntB antirepressor family protein [Glaesserella parasuis]MDG6372646.1 antA/AntB antirepressor family protein [Glaesserella parasuis]MDG6444569.1 antA/AntB antirepressor family protein [Glaesserella parasuis]